MVLRGNSDPSNGPEGKNFEGPAPRRRGTTFRIPRTRRPSSALAADDLQRGEETDTTL